MLKVYSYNEGEKLDTTLRSDIKKKSPSIDKKIDNFNNIEDEVHDLSEEIKKEFLKEQEEDTLKRKKASIQISRQKSAMPSNRDLNTNKNEGYNKPILRAPGIQQMKGGKSTYIKNLQKNQFFSRTLRYQTYIPDIAPIKSNIRYSSSHSRLASGKVNNGPHLKSNSNLEVKAELSFRPNTVSDSNIIQDFQKKAIPSRCRSQDIES